MKKKKTLGLLLGLVLVLGAAIPGTLAVSAGTAGEEPAGQASLAEARPTDESSPDSLFDRLMKCETYEELMVMMEAVPEEAFTMLTAEQAAQVEEKILALEPQPLPEVVLEETSDEPVPSEIVYPTVSYDKVAPLGDPVMGGTN